jgi:hypothetical protein
MEVAVSQTVMGPRNGVAIYPPPGPEWPWLVVVFDQRGVEAFTYEDGDAARIALADKSLAFAYDQAERGRRPKDN